MSVTENATTEPRPLGGRSKQHEREQFVARNFRRNFLMMLLDASMFPFGMSFVSVITILPLFVREITTSSLAIGLVPAINSLGVLLPPLFVANRVEQLPVQRWVVFWMAMAERVPLLVIALAAFWLGRADPQALLWIFFVMYAVHNLLMGMTLPAYMNLYAKVIPINRRASMWGIGGAVGGALAVGGAWVSRQMLSGLGFPDAYALLFLIAFLVLTVGNLGFLFVRELPSTERPEPVSSLRYLLSAPALLRADRRFGFFVLSQAVGAGAFVAPAFYTAYAIDRFHAQPAQIAIFTTVLVATNTVANLVLGPIGDRFGNKLVLQVATVAGIAAPLVALQVPSVHWMYLVFALNSFLLIGNNIGGNNLPLEFAPRQQIATYSAISMTATAPFRAALPMLGGAIAAGGYGGVFVLSAVTALLGLALVVWKVPDPRREVGA